MAEREAAAREYARAHPGVPLLWATDVPVPGVGRVWHELHEMAPETGLVPITFSWEFAGLAPGSDEPLSDAALRMMRPARLGLVAASRPSDVLSLTGFSGFTNRFRTPAEFTAVLRTWEERFGAVLFEVGFADVRVLVTRPPRTRRAAEFVAAEIRAICDEFWPIERPGIALSSIGEIAGYVKDAPFWGLWWD